jgi:membrane-associated protease RseP (regulator of RpoE activity)
MTALLTICALFALVSATHTLGLLLAGRACGATALELSLFVGPKLCRFHAAGMRVSIGCIPIGGYVKFHSTEDEAGESSPDPDAAPRRPFNTLHPLVRVAVTASGCVALLLVASLCLGPTGAWPAFLRGFSQFPAMALGPFSSGKALVARLVEVGSVMPFATALGLLSAKIAALNLLPLPVLNGGEIVLTGLRWKRPANVRFEVVARIVGLIGLLWLAVSALLAVGGYLFSAA